MVTKVFETFTAGCRYQINVNALTLILEAIILSGRTKQKCGAWSRRLVIARILSHGLFITMQEYVRKQTEQNYDIMIICFRNVNLFGIDDIADYY